ncbi:MAG: hypothetical protein CMB80_31450 [Flammeovirgaceae bacterium]|nr:hypothetical protein [Flammeovirgaceae bacterium]MBE61949.1 hypothetical protein [Flammeovirgaceae bacterium]HCX23587.1 hypothetical protein [Cytophagales bacterium]
MSPFHFIFNNLFRQKNQKEDPQRIVKARKIIGFIGAIDHKLDYTLLEHLVSNFPMLDFHFIGPINDFKQAMMMDKYSNVQFFGNQSTPEIKNLSADFDLAILPYTNHEQLTIHQIKANLIMLSPEISIISSYALKDHFGASLNVVSSPDEFVNAIAEATGITSISLSENLILQQFA